MVPTNLTTLCTSVNGDSPIDATLLTSLINIGKAILEGERDWMVLRKINTSLSVSASSSNQWNTSISISGITDFLRFYGDYPIKIFDGNTGVEEYRQVPFSKRLEYKDVPNTFVHDIVGKKIYLNGNINISGTLYINYIMNTADIDMSSVVDMETSGVFPFPSRFHPILAFYAVGMQKGAIDYDSINREMLPQNQSILLALKNAMEKWDTQLQLGEQMQTDPSGNDIPDRRFGMVNMEG